MRNNCATVAAIIPALNEASTVTSVVEQLAKRATVIVGVRDRQQRFAEYVFASVSRRLWRIDDPLCGMKGYRLDRFRNAGPFDQYKSIGTRYAIIAGRSRFIIRQIPVSVRPRIDAPRFASGWLGNFVILKAMLLGLFLARSVRA